MPTTLAVLIMAILGFAGVLALTMLGIITVAASLGSALSVFLAPFQAAIALIRRLTRHQKVAEPATQS